MKRFAVLLLATFVGAPWLMAQTSPSAGQDDTVVEEIIARINNNIITRADLRRSQEQLQADSRQPDPSGAASDPKERQQDLLRDLIDQQLLLQKGEELGISADTDVVKRLDELRKQMHAESMEDLEKAAQAQGVSWEEFKQNLKNSIITQHVISQEVGGHINVSQQEIQQFYDQHKSEMERPEQVRMSEILISTQKQAGGQDRERAGGAAGDSEPGSGRRSRGQGGQGLRPAEEGRQVRGPGQAVLGRSRLPLLGGDLEYFKRGTLSKDLEERVFAMNAGGYTEPVRTNQGWVILKVTEHQTAGIPPLKEVEGRVQEQIYMTKMQPALRDYLTKLREDAYIDIKAGYVDTGASPNETKPIYTTTATEGSSKAKKKKKFGLF